MDMEKREIIDRLYDTENIPYVGGFSVEELRIIGQFRRYR